MRPLLVALLLALAACSPPGGSPGGEPARLPQTQATQEAPAVWPLRGTPARDRDEARRRPIVVKVDGDPAARPLSGFADADLVIEIPVEGGATRYAAVFHSADPAKVGPVRSARQSDLNYLPLLRAIVAHVGASEAVTKLIADAARGGDFVDVDELQRPDAFERVRDRVAPYNAFSSGAKIRQAAGRAASERVTVAGLRFGELASGGADGVSLTVPYAESVRYEFDGKAAYRRTYAGGGRTTDTSAGEVLPENVVVVKTDVKEIAGTADASGAASVDYRATGSGPVVILRDGKRFEGTWSRTGSDLYTFADASGAPIPLRPGLTWIHIVPLSFDLRG